MYPDLLKIGIFTIHSYGFMVAIAFLVGIYLATQRAISQNLSKELIFDMGLCVFASSIIGARLLYCVLNFDFYIQNPIKIIFIHEGGLSFYGGLITAFCISIWFLKRYGLPVWKVSDIVAPSLAIGQSIGRIGCFMYGCCYGKPTTLPWGVRFPEESLAGSQFGNTPIHPTQLYTCLIELLIFVSLLILERKKRFDGQIFFFYLFLTSSSRFILEFLRVDTPTTFLHLTIFQLISIILCIIAINAYFALWSKEKEEA
jgi:phosphatidylglycerol:prolipoprotein diacylglycerol transferase